ncbi:hypothetical protein JM16_004478 [Phytophthora kernoviae]|uniref:Uncharacterized protein n=1 Tax=Phytophthora kernoviae TaxID=325452 RepID=A0A8T0LVP4_9STRA|nr:hypothetical protein JM16_004478 [Phytophthora kernoviae]
MVSELVLETVSVMVSETVPVMVSELVLETVSVMVSETVPVMVSELALETVSVMVMVWVQVWALKSSTSGWTLDSVSAKSCARLSRIGAI